MFSISPTAYRPATIGVLVVLALLAADDARSDETWRDRIGDEETRTVLPRNVELLSLQVSKLPRNAFGRGERPPGSAPLTGHSWVVGSGTGLFGTFEIETEGTLVFLEEQSSLSEFLDDQSRDLTAEPDMEPPDTFFQPNKPVWAGIAPDRNLVVFTLRGYRTPTAGASRLDASANLQFLVFDNEQSAETPDLPLKSGTSAKAGPIEVTFYAADDIPERRRRVGPPDMQADWAVQIAARTRPLKSIELVDDAGNVLQRTEGAKFEGREYFWHIPSLEAKTVTLRVHWYDSIEQIRVPLNVSTTLGI